ncbi:MAG: hypothetical protein LBI38_05275 [Oscillospiraceae bacterium]|jgi:hypothetical protein|nr:hypothetical protein [Oscillospiraceae bacterium]
MKDSKKIFEGAFAPIALTLVLVVAVLAAGHPRGGASTLANEENGAPTLANEENDAPVQRQQESDAPVQRQEPRDGEPYEGEGRSFSVRTNKNGQTYGSMRNSDGFCPDLIGVRASNGKSGYVYSTEWDDPSLCFTVLEMEELNKQGIFAIGLPVYDENGENVIGEFEVSVNAGNVFVGTDEELEEYLSKRRETPPETTDYKVISLEELKQNWKN